MKQESGCGIARTVVNGFGREKRDPMLETHVIGNKEWVEGFLTAEDVRSLENLDCEMRIRHLQQKPGRQKVKTYEQLVEEHGDGVPTHCEHGIPRYRKCGICRALLG